MQEIDEIEKLFATKTGVVFNVGTGSLTRHQFHKSGVKKHPIFLSVVYAQRLISRACVEINRRREKLSK